MIGAVPAIASALRKRRGVVLATCAATAARAAAPTGCGSGRAARRRRRAHAGAPRAPSGRARAASRRSASWPAGAGIPPPRSRRSASRDRAAVVSGPTRRPLRRSARCSSSMARAVGSPGDASRTRRTRRARVHSAVPTPPTARRTDDHQQQRRAPAAVGVVGDRRVVAGRGPARELATLGDGGRRCVRGVGAGVGGGLLLGVAAAGGRVRRCRIEGDPPDVREVGLDPGVRVDVADDHLAALVVAGARREAGRDPRRDARHAQQERHRPGELLAVAGLLLEQERVERDVGALRRLRVAEAVREVLLDAPDVRRRRRGRGLQLLAQSPRARVARGLQGRGAVARVAAERRQVQRGSLARPPWREPDPRRSSASPGSSRSRRSTAGRRPASAAPCSGTPGWRAGRSSARRPVHGGSVPARTPRPCRPGRR